MVGLMAAAAACTVPIRARSQAGLSLTPAAVLTAVATLPGGWAVLCCAFGAAVGMMVRGRWWPPVAYGAATVAVGAGAAVLTIHMVGLPTSTGGVARPEAGVAPLLVSLAAGAAAYAVVDEFAASAASGQRWRQHTTCDLRARSIARCAHPAIAAGMVLAANASVITAATLLLVVAHLIRTRRLRVLQEQQARGGLLQAMHSLAAVAARGDRDGVLRCAVRYAFLLMPGVVKVEIQLGRRTFPNPGQSAGRLHGHSNRHVVVALGSIPAGSLWIGVCEGTRWTDREQALLADFGAAVGTAVRSCQTFEALAHDANHDVLTGLANRRLFHQRVDQLLRGGHDAALLALDLDRFKEVNDRIGHHAGDSVLAAAATRIRSAIRADDLAVRFGGDEFVVLLADLSTPDDAVLRAQRILRALAGSLTVDNAEVLIGASAGLAFARSCSAAELLRRADLALYHAKADRGPRHLRLRIYTGSLEHRSQFDSDTPRRPPPSHPPTQDQTVPVLLPRPRGTAGSCDVECSAHHFQV